MTSAKEHVEKLQRLYEEGGEEAIAEFAESNPAEYFHAIEALYVVEEDFDGLEDFQASVSEACRNAMDEHLSKEGFSAFDEIIRLARKEGRYESVEKLERYLKRLRH